MGVSDYGYIPCGLDIELSDKELYFLRAAGIAPHMLNNSDRAAVIQALMNDNDLIENPQAGGPLALIYKFGILRAMLEHQEHQAKEEEEEEIKEKKKKEEKKLQEEFNRYVQMGPQEYMQANPLPMDFSSILWTVQALPLLHTEELSKTEMQTTSLMNEEARQAEVQTASRDTVNLSLSLENILQEYNRIPHTIALVPEHVSDSDPTHLKAPQGEKPHTEELKPLERMLRHDHGHKPR